ncbi:hypothetical protein ES319_D01G192800v1 [Gossypium barbadense]|uniref:CTP synthase N-terminal domain-containing protein n=2 Tax=Gossypium TaxID=3633 RepID=A0A5J5SWC1_GOSBA|nr:hypothetical protein ES319_D01G192800v1 [Gossypium barbadense]TYG83923.1 hypothetical protein ES288_D01G207600v1 [Gossypium darwinii]
MVPNTNRRHSSLIFLLSAFRCRNLHCTNRRWRSSSSLEGKDNFCLIHVILIPDLLTCCLAQPLLDNTKMKLSQFCHVEVANILNIHYVPNIWHIPLLLRVYSIAVLPFVWNLKIPSLILLFSF